MRTSEQLLQDNSELILAFRIGEKGKQGGLRFLGEQDINEFTSDLFEDEDSGEYVDESGNFVGLDIDNDGTGVIDRDGDYDTTYCLRVSELTENELGAIYYRGRGYYGQFAEDFTACIENEGGL